MEGEISKLNISEIRSKHISEPIEVKAKIIQASDVRPQAISAKFECLSCGANIEFAQTRKIFMEPEKCSCGGSNFKEISKEFVDSQRLVVQDLEEALFEGEIPKIINVFLREPLTNPDKREIILPGKKVRILGELKEIPVYLDNGELSTRFELAIDAEDVSRI
jgi:DNA replicative helicase MCM subunit Mcm2 (Cdc46/Mcm family)